MTNFTAETKNLQPKKKFFMSIANFSVDVKYTGVNLYTTHQFTFYLGLNHA